MCVAFVVIRYDREEGCKYATEATLKNGRKVVDLKLPPTVRLKFFIWYCSDQIDANLCVWA